MVVVKKTSSQDAANIERAQSLAEELKQFHAFNKAMFASYPNN